MKYLIASEGNSLEGNVSGHYGKAPFFLIYDNASGGLNVIVNDEKVDPHLVIRDSAKAGVKTLICGGIGPHAFQTADKHKVKVCIASEIPVSEAVKLAGEGKLPVTSEPTAHHGQHEHHTDHHGPHQA